MIHKLAVGPKQYNLEFQAALKTKELNTGSIHWNLTEETPVSIRALSTEENAAPEAWAAKAPDAGEDAWKIRVDGAYGAFLVHF